MQDFNIQKGGVFMSQDIEQAQVEHLIKHMLIQGCEVTEETLFDVN